MTVYKITNLANGKIYIGKTIHSLGRRWSIHVAHALRHMRYAKTIGKSYLHNAIRKYGPSSFIIEPVCTCASTQDLADKEELYIRTYQSYLPDKGYNLVMTSTDNSYVSPSTREKMTIASHQKDMTRQSSFRGVVYANLDGQHDKNPWIARITHRHKSFSKRFSTESQAVESYDKMALFLYKESAVINNADQKDEYLKENLSEFFNWFTFKPKQHSKFRGVGFYKKDKLFNARITTPHGRLFLGVFSNEEAAAIAYDKVCFFLYKNKQILNFPTKAAEYQNCDLQSFYNSLLNPIKQRNRKTSSQFRGVSKHKQGTGWCSEFRCAGKRLRGFFLDEMDAARFYDVHAWLLKKEKAHLNLRESVQETLNWAKERGVIRHNAFV